ncbi:SDR family NAD(P)-dependent oxidoreductase [Brachybacterium phenoliresistens]|uniref:SDR family NAD(P)-dependent oxidoreductase n=1 Tax=Brachybacterium phenoliresistens TaxID=396014 RepID=UPI0031DF729E
MNAPDPVPPAEPPAAPPRPRSASPRLPGTAGSPAPVRRVLLVGCGKLGTRLGRRLLEGGDEVLALRRAPDDLPEGFVPIAADLSEPLPEPLPAVDAMVITLPPGDAELGYRAPLRHLADVLPRVPTRTVFVSSTRVLEGLGGAEPLTEAAVPQPTSVRGLALRDGEERARDLFGALVVRPAGIYGPGRDHLVRGVRAGRAVDHSRRTNRIHETDLVRTLALLLDLEDPPPLLHAVDDSPALLGEVLAHIADRLELPLPASLEPRRGGGTVLSGRLLAELLGPLEVPDFRAGYDAIIAADQHR